ncbi:hypothetical protein GA0115251_11605 [Streptomyces sp. TverLS-915]|nr:hypothetical protein GA0115251_11605 [Streptomyces sp. TverLS-915]
MNDMQGIPPAPPDRDLPNHRRMREELLMKITEPRDNAASSHRRWMVPLGVAAGVSAVSVAAVAVFGATGDTEPRPTDRALSGTSPSGASRGGDTAPGAAPASPSASPSGSPSGSASAGTSGPSSKRSTTVPDTNAFRITKTGTTPIAAATTAKILASCLGPDASRFHSVVALRTPAAGDTTDGVVVAVDSAGQYAQCAAKGEKGSSPDVPPTFINDRLWGTGRVISYFDTVQEPTGDGQFLISGAGHYTSDVARVTVSYGDKPKEYPARMAGGAFVYAATLSPDTPPDRHFAGPAVYVHAYDASGKEVYNQAKDPKFTSD